METRKRKEKLKELHKECKTEIERERKTISKRWTQEKMEENRKCKVSEYRVEGNEGEA